MYFAARETRRNRLASTAIPAGFVNDLLLACRSRRKVLILDCCYSGAFATGLRVKADPQVHTAAQFDARGLVVLTATDSAQYAFEGDTVRGAAVRSAFTAALICGLDTGEADVDRDGVVSVDDAHEYVRRRLADQVPRQSPRKWEFDVQGRIVLARSRHSDTAVSTPATPHEWVAGAGGETPVAGRLVWWAGLGLVTVSAALAAALATWPLLNWTYSMFPNEYLAPSVAYSVAAAAVAGAGWGIAYAVADAVELAGRPASVRWHISLLRWMRTLGTAAVAAGPLRLLRAMATAVPLNVAVAMALSQGTAALCYGLYGSQNRDRLFSLAMIVLNAAPIAAYLRRSVTARTRQKR